jgi:hypothetical protein
MMPLFTRLAQISQDEVNLPNQVDPALKTGFVSQQLQGALQVAFGVLGAIAVLVIVIAAMQYVISAGDPQKVSKAKDTIIYAMVGLVVAILAFAIVTFILDGVFS